MNSLVVLLSMVVLATAKPSGNLAIGALTAYSAPIIAAASAAVSHQSRIDIKSSPAIVETAAITPLASRTVFAEPTFLSTPALVGPAAVSSQSRIDIKSTPAIANTVIASAPLTYSATYGTAAIAPSLLKSAVLAPGITTTAIGPAVLKTISPAIASPTLIKSAALVPAAIEGSALSLGTAEIAAARFGHFVTEGQELNTVHLLKKRSAPVFATPALTYASAPLVSTYSANPLVYSAPVSVVNPIVTKAYGVHPW